MTPLTLPIPNSWTPENTLAGIFSVDDDVTP